jgi:hypothetical protein
VPGGSGARGFRAPSEPLVERGVELHRSGGPGLDTRWALLDQHVRAHADALHALHGLHADAPCKRCTLIE